MSQCLVDGGGGVTDQKNKLEAFLLVSVPSSGISNVYDSSVHGLQPEGMAVWDLD